MSVRDRIHRLERIIPPDPPNVVIAYLSEEAGLHTQTDAGEVEQTFDTEAELEAEHPDADLIYVVDFMGEPDHRPV